MRRSKLFFSVTLVVLAASMVLAAGCSSKGGSSSDSTTATVVQPQPTVESVAASPSGTQSNYYTTLDIKVKNNGADGMIEVQASVTQSGKTSQESYSVFLKKGAEYEAPLIFPRVWEGDGVTYEVHAIVP